MIFEELSSTFSKLPPLIRGGAIVSRDANSDKYGN